MKNSLVSEPPTTWFAWSVMSLGALVTISAIWLTFSNPDRTAILFVLVPGTAIGMLLMVLGALGARVLVVLKQANANGRESPERTLLLYIALGFSAGLGTGIPAGLAFGSVALGITVAPLVGVAFAMAVWTRRHAVGDA